MAKWAKLSIIILLCMALCACSSKSEASKDDIAQEYSGFSEISVCADVTADCGDSIFEYGMKYSGSDVRGTITITAPESIAGLEIKADSASGETKLVYDGAELMAGELNEEGLNPVSAIPMMITQWKSGYVSEAQTELLDGAKLTALTYLISDETNLKTWFDPDTLLPYRAEIVTNGKTVVFCSFQDVTIN